MATGAAALGSAFAIACGGDDAADAPIAPRSTRVPGLTSGSESAWDVDETPVGGSVPGAATGSATQLTDPVDTTAAARQGGTYRHAIASDLLTFDPHILSFAGAYQVLLNYNRLFRIRPGHLERSAGAVEGDLAASWELSPDRLTLTLHLRGDARMPDVSPVAGRALNAEDVVYSWERWKAIGAGRSDLVNELNPGAPIVSLAAADRFTVVLTLQQPASSLLPALASQVGGAFFVLPVEAERFDPHALPIGAGPYYRSEYEPANRILYVRNENHYEASRLYPDAIETSIVPEPSAGQALLKSGRLHHYAVPPERVLPTKLEAPELDLYRGDLRDTAVDQVFGFQPGNGTPFRDARLRQAWSMMMDRDLYLDVFSDRARFEAAGLAVDRAWSSATIPTQYHGWWLDPRSEAFGENARYYEHDVAEARALVEAAGFPEGVTVAAHMIAGAEYGAAYPQHVEALMGMASEPRGPFRLDIRTHAYGPDWFDTIRDSKGYFDGVAFRLTPLPQDPAEQLHAVYNAGGSLYYGFDAEGLGTPQGEAFTGDPTVQELTAAMRAEFNDEARMSLAHRLQQHLGGQQYFVTRLGATTGFDLVWPFVKNWLVYQSSDHARRLSSYWFDSGEQPWR